MEPDNLGSLQNQAISMESSDPPFQEFYKKLFDNEATNKNDNNVFDVVEEGELPLIDLNRLNIRLDKENCKSEIVKASQELGFFQVINHGVSSEILANMRCEQMKLFKRPFQEKANNIHPYLNCLATSYRWGTPTATCLKQIAWSEAFHVSLAGISATVDVSTLSATTKDLVTKMHELSQRLAEILAEQLGSRPDYFKENCSLTTCFLRLNRYPVCPFSPQVFGLMPHTDSDFLTILHQDQIGGLQLVKEGKWIGVKPNPNALIINIGDLLQAWSNDVYKSVEHRVVANTHVERFSTAFFFCPSYDTMIQSDAQNSVYRRFSYEEFRQQVEDDVKIHGHKKGLSRFKK